MLTYTWKPRNVFFDSSSEISLEDLLGKPVQMGAEPVISNGQITVTVPAEGSYRVRVKTKNTHHVYRINVNDTANDAPAVSFNPGDFIPKPSGIADGQVPVWDATQGKFVAGGSSGGTVAHRTVPVFVFIGESNSGGQARNADLTTAEKAVRPAVQVLHATSLVFQDMQIGVNNTTGHTGLTSSMHGWEAGLATEVEANKYMSSNVYLVKAGHGGSKMSQWLTDGSYMSTFRTRINAVKTLLKAQGLIPQFYVWHSHGINDYISSGALTPAAFKTEMKNMHALIRKELGFVPIIMTELMPAFETYNVVMREMVAEIAGTFIAETTDLPLDDAYHWSSAGMKTLAYRMGDISRAWGEHEGYPLGQGKALFFGGGVGAGGTASSDTSAPSAVSALTAGTPTPSSIPLSWTAATDNISVTGYEYSTNGTSYTSTGSTAVSYTISGLTPSTSYTLYIRAFDGAGNRGPSSSVSATTAVAVAGSLPVSDTFTGTTATLTSRPADTGGTWVKQAGTAEITLDGAGKAVVSNGGGWTIWRNEVTPATADYTASVDVTPSTVASGHSGPVIRASGTNNWAVLTQGPYSGDKLMIVTNVNGAITVPISTNFAYAANTSYRLSITGTGSTLKGKIQRLTDNMYFVSNAWQSAEGFALTTTTALTSVGAPGLGVALAPTDGTKFDNFNATN